MLSGDLGTTSRDTTHLKPRQSRGALPSRPQTGIPNIYPTDYT